MRKRNWGMFLSTVLVLAVVGCSPSAPKQTEEPKVKAIIIRASTPTAPEHPWTKGLELVAKLVNERTEGRYKINVYPNASLSEGSEKTMTEQIFTGTLDMGISPAPLCSTVFSAFSFPFSYTDREHIARVCASPVAQEMLASLDEKGMHAVAYVENGFRQITNSKHAIKTPADMVGVKIRTPQSAATIAAMKAMGANPVAVSAGELYIALSQGTVDGQENALSTIYNNKYYEVQKYLTVINYNWSPAIVGMSREVWNKLSEGDKKIFQDAILEAAADINKQLAGLDGEMIGKLKEKGMQVYVCTESDVALFKAKCDTDALREVYKGILGEDLMTRFFDAVKLAKK